MDKFEKLIKKTVDSYEAPYSEAAWAAMSDKLGPEKGGFAGWIVGATIAAAAVIFGVWYLVPNEANQRNLIVEEKANTTNTVMPNTNSNNETVEIIDVVNDNINNMVVKLKQKLNLQLTITLLYLMI